MTGAASLENVGFPYQPLDNTKQQIRLLVVGRSNDGAGYQYTLRRRSLNKKPCYRALSYQWGTGTPDYNIHVNNQRFYIRKSVHDFLGTMPIETLVGAWFIDAICINQSDPLERASQVRLMGALYSQAQSVISWLGPDQDQSHSGLCLRARILSAWTVHPTAEYGDLLRWLRLDDARLRVILTAKRASCRTYWTRLWVVQEVLLAQRLCIMLGNREVPVKSVIDWAEGNHFHNWRSEYWSVRSRPASWLTGFGTTASRSQHHYPLYEALITFGTQDSLDPRDTIFGLLGLARTNVVPDYSLTTTDVWLYVLVEGLYKIHLEIRKLRKRDTQPLAHDFVQACALALNLSPQHITVAMIARTAVKLCLPNLTVVTGYSSWEATTHHRPRSTRWHYLCQNVALLSRTQARRLGCTVLRERYQVWVGRLVELLQSSFLALLRASNHAIPMPDGTQHTYEDWDAQVRKTLDLVKANKPPQSASTTIPLKAESTPQPKPQPPHMHCIIRYAGCGIGLFANVTCGLLLASIGAAIGRYAESVNAFRWQVWATDDWIWNVMAPFMLLAHVLDTFTTAGRYPFASQIVEGWGTVWDGT